MISPRESCSRPLHLHLEPQPLSGAAEGPSIGGASPPSGGGASPKTMELSPAPVPTTAIRGTAMHNNRIHRPDVVTQRAAVESTGVVTRYRRVRPDNNNNNNNNNNHATLAEMFQPSTLNKLRQLGLCINTNT